MHVCLKVLSVCHVCGREYQAVLRHTYASRHTARLVSFVVQLHVLQYALHQTLAVGSIVYGKVSAKSQMRTFLTQYSGEDTVESTHPQARGSLLPHHSAYTLAHLLCSLVGKGQSQYVPWLHTRLQQICYLACQHSRLARAGTRYYQRGSITAKHSLALAFIQIFCYHIIPVQGLHLIYIYRTYHTKKETSIASNIAQGHRLIPYVSNSNMSRTERSVPEINPNTKHTTIHSMHRL